MNVKEAAYATVCGECGCRVQERDDVALFDGEWVHASCAQDIADAILLGLVA